jgi:lipoprotein-anchoring transpeptidase ErfK/SrfK
MPELRPGVWHWQSPHPGWNEEQWWPQLVSSYRVELGDDFLLFDPRTIAVSSGKPSTPTPPGNYRVYAKIERWWSVPFREWLPWAVPFVGGIAFHQFGVVPTYPASHGCVRQDFSVARMTYDFAEVGMPVRVVARS